MNTNPNIEQARTLLAKCREITEAVRKQWASQDPLRVARDAAAQALASVDTQQALALAAGDTVAAQRAEAQAAPLAAALSAAEIALQRAERIGAALLDHLREAEAGVRTEASVLRVDLQAERQADHEALAEEFRKLAQPLIDSLPRLAARASAAGLSGTLHTLRDLCVPDLSSPGARWVDLGRVKAAASGATVEMTTAAAPPEPSPLRRTLAALESYRPFDPNAPMPPAPAAPTVPPEAPSTPKVPAAAARAALRSRGPSMAQRLA